MASTQQQHRPFVRVLAPTDSFLTLEPSSICIFFFKFYEMSKIEAASDPLNCHKDKPNLQAAASKALCTYVHLSTSRMHIRLRLSVS